ncbi:DUF6673 family protein [Anaerostipes sp. AF04-45]|uniref:DUF6673 family protein n=1 Tax=Anaerostipes sp. AF04-45 TaxID=2292912 RepID=UPI000E470E4A|nr:DUF6673 family protein [Anaerostipes sp. AF04-45]RGH20329.1 hypothetical protein DWV34_16815 [Anaerostipes sp. AF04-45]
MNKIFKWNGAEFKFSALDADMIEKFGTIKQQTFEELMEYEKKHEINGVLNAEGVRAECKIIDRTFDKLLGDGAAKKMFSDTDIHERVAAFNKLVNLREAQVESYNKLVQSMAGD